MKIFVYGTLKRGFCRSGFLEDQEFLGEVRTLPIYSLYDLGSFPGLVESHFANAESIQGELWEIEPSCLRLLDQVEGVPDLYKRQKVEIEDYEDDEIQTYIFQGLVEGHPNCGTQWTQNDGVSWLR